MNKLKEATQSGNNIEAARAIRIIVNLFDTGGVNTNVFGQYYFDEYPELNNKTIVGIKFNTNLGQAQNNTPDFDTPNLSLDNNLGRAAFYADDLYAGYLMVNLFNDKNELIIQNMPLNSLNYIVSNNTGGKIIPFDTKLNLKRSYIFSTRAFTTTDPISVSLTFYYLDK